MILEQSPCLACGRQGFGQAALRAALMQANQRLGDCDECRGALGGVTQALFGGADLEPERLVAAPFPAAVHAANRDRIEVKLQLLEPVLLLARAKYEVDAALD